MIESRAALNKFRETPKYVSNAMRDIEQLSRNIQLLVQYANKNYLAK